MLLLLQVAGGIVLAALLLGYIRFNYHLYHDLRLAQKHISRLSTKYCELRMDYNDLKQQLQHKHH